MSYLKLYYRCLYNAIEGIEHLKDYLKNNGFVRWRETTEQDQRVIILQSYIDENDDEFAIGSKWRFDKEGKFIEEVIV